ncbi:MAG: helix-turn-helix domain-containing protein [Treponema sp.]|jgi:transcriptional regulator with XRE-family HTH domain|nr:helix-turn-helix domain-containing protein [Treponema sp.]
MNDTVNQRIKGLRKILKLTQTEFARVITVSAGQLACIETGKRIVNGRTVKLICDSFKVNDRWLRLGEEPVFTNKENRYVKLTALYDVLKPEYQEYILKAINNLLEIQDGEGKGMNNSPPQQVTG